MRDRDGSCYDDARDDIVMDWQGEIARQGPLVLVFGLVLLFGYRKAWMFTYQHLDLQAASDRVIAEKDKTIAEKDKAMTILRDSYEARLREKDEECARERARLTKSEGFTDRLLMTSIDAVAIAGRAATVVARKDGGAA